MSGLKQCLNSDANTYSISHYHILYIYRSGLKQCINSDANTYSVKKSATLTGNNNNTNTQLVAHHKSVD